MKGHHVKVGTRAWGFDSSASNADDVRLGVGAEWVEIDGHRFEGVVAAEVVVDTDRFVVPVVTLRLVGPVEIAYLDDAGEQIRLEYRDPADLPAVIEAGTILTPADLVEG